MASETKENETKGNDIFPYVVIGMLLLLFINQLIILTRIDFNQKHIDSLYTEVEEVRVNANSMTGRLEATSREAGHAQGVADEKARDK